MSLQRPCAQNTDVMFTTLLKLPSGERIEMAGCGLAPLLSALTPTPEPLSKLLKLSSGERIEMAGCGPAPLLLACRRRLTCLSMRVAAGVTHVAPGGFVT